MKEKIIRFLVIIVSITMLVWGLLGESYKEILICDGNNCSVKRYSILKYMNNTYYFNRNDDIQIQWTQGVKGGRSLAIINHSDSDKLIFQQMSSNSNTRKIFNIIKSNKSHIKITKYWFGYKVEE